MLFQSSPVQSVSVWSARVGGKLSCRMTGTSTGHPWLPLVVPVEARNVRDGVERARRQEDVLPDDDRVHCPSSAATGGSSLGAGRPGWRGARAPAGLSCRMTNASMVHPRL